MQCEYKIETEKENQLSPGSISILRKMKLNLLRVVITLLQLLLCLYPEYTLRAVPDSAQTKGESLFAVLRMGKVT